MIFSLSYLFVYRNSPKFLLWNFGAHFFPSTNVWSNRRWMFSFMFFLLNWLQSNSSVVGSPNINFTTYGNPLFCSLRLEKSAVCLLLVWSFDEYVDRMKRMYYDHFSEKWRRVNVQPKCVWTEIRVDHVDGRKIFFRRTGKHQSPIHHHLAPDNDLSSSSENAPIDSFLSLLHHIFLTCKFPKNWKEFVNGWKDRLAMMESLKLCLAFHQCRIGYCVSYCIEWSYGEEAENHGKGWTATTKIVILNNFVVISVVING